MDQTSEPSQASGFRPISDRPFTQLGSLADNGGPLKTYAPSSSGSPVVDAGDNDQAVTGAGRRTQLGSGSTAAQAESLQPKYQNIWSPRYIDALILRDENTDQDDTCDDDRVYYLADANFNVTALVNTSGTVVERYLYTPYGEVTVLDSDFSSDADGDSDYSNTTLYTGRTFDPAIGLYYYRHRVYHPQLGRFVTRDPIGYAAGELILYRYCADNPLSYTDPSGTDWLDCMAECIKDNDPLPYALGAGIKAVLLYGGYETKWMMAQAFKLANQGEIAKDILHYAKMPGQSKLTNITSTIGTVLSKMTSGQKTAMWHKMGHFASSILGPIEVGYGLALAGIEVHCVGWCTTAQCYGIRYNHADGNVMDAWKNKYFGGSR